MTDDFKAGMMRAAEMCHKNSDACSAESKKLPDALEQNCMASSAIALAQMAVEILQAVEQRA